MTIPFDCGALDPESLKYRRLTRGLRYPYVDWEDACEIVAWITFMGKRDAQILMRWSRVNQKYIARLFKNPELLADAGRYVDANREAAQLSDAFRVLELAQSYGSTITHTNPLIRRALQEEWHTTGITAQQQAEKYNLTRGEVQRLRTPRKPVGVASQLHRISFG